jgi:hypothetical protein
MVLFKGTFSNSDYIASNESMLNERIEKAVGKKRLWPVVLSRNLPAETEKPTKTLARLAGLWADF